MTPEELDAIESRMAKAFPAIDYKRDSDTDMPALCAALRAAWAERDGARADNESLESALADAREDLEAQTNLAHFTLANAKDAMAERDAAIKERDEWRARNTELVKAAHIKGPAGCPWCGRLAQHVKFEHADDCLAFCRNGEAR